MQISPNVCGRESPKVLRVNAIRFGNHRGTTPEKLIAAARAGCSALRLAFWLQARYMRTDLSTEAPGSGFGIRRSALTLCVKYRISPKRPLPISPKRLSSTLRSRKLDA